MAQRLIHLTICSYNFTEIMSALKYLLSECQTPFVTWLGPKAFVMIDHADDIQTVLNAKGCLEKGDIYRFFNRGAALLSAPRK